ncbi:family 10 glycosylhydrolase [Lachnospiraceae bacterium 54-53]
MNETIWWKRPMRVIQYNLQVADTPLMDPEKIAGDLEEDYANAVVFNVGGIYAWYRSRVKYHHVNEFLPKGRDLLRELIEACHKRDIKVIARFDFSKTDDIVYLNRPDWFVQQKDKAPLIYGKERMGSWSLLLTTCINGGYRNEEVAVPVLEEVVRQYDIDGIFFNAPHGSPCWCERCREKYRNLYGTGMPSEAEDFAGDWQSVCLKDNISLLNKAVKNIREDMPLILYYYGFDLLPGETWTVDDLDERYASADLICTEAQDVLSLGVRNVPAIWKPCLNMKIGSAVPGYPKPFGIIHSCPGMDWRHAGLPRAEYMFWMAQVMANNAHIWHSITGFNDTVTDKRLLAAVREINRMVSLCEEEMDQAVPSSQVLLLWDGSRSASGWVEGMCSAQYQFDLMDIHHLDPERMKRYPVVVVPSGFLLRENLALLLEAYAGEGGHLLIEKNDAQDMEALKDLMGIQKDVTVSGNLTASYLRLETGDERMRKGLEEITFIPLRGQVLYMKPRQGNEVFMTLVPPFAPMDAVGAPPERASMPVSRTDLPMVLCSPYKAGCVMTLAFPLSELILDYHLEDHYLTMRNCLDYLTGEAKELRLEENVNGLLATVYHKENKILVHLINGAGQRPLAGTVPLWKKEFSIKLPEGAEVTRAVPVLEDEELTYRQMGDVVTVSLKKLSVWNMIIIETA